MAKTKKTATRKRTTKSKVVKRKSRATEKVVLREKNPDYMIQINDPRSLRKELLETLREIIIFMQSYEKFRKIQEEKVMIFVNEIAEIVHDITAENAGSANKNIGDAFLLVWKIDEKFVFFF